MLSGDWELTITGEIVRVDREDLDKSGRNPKYVLSFVLRPDGPDAIVAPAGAILPRELAVRVRDKDLARLAPRAPKVGDRVTVRARASGPRPATLQLTSVTAL